MELYTPMEAARPFELRRDGTAGVEGERRVGEKEGDRYTSPNIPILFIGQKYLGN